MKYNAVEIEKMLDGMQIVIDTREQDTPALKRRTEGFNCPSIRSKLDFGDYSMMFTLPDGTEIVGQNIAVIERKMSLDELANCYTKGRARYSREFERATKYGTHIHTIIENANYENIYSWKYRSQLKPKSFIASYLSWAERYNIQLHFCKAETTPRLIKDILHYALREYLLNLE